MKKRLDILLVEKKLVQSRSQARALIMTEQVLVNDKIISKAGTLIPEIASVTIKQKMPYVSRGGLKLKGAIDHFGLKLKGDIVLDIGASTGGFTDCCLQEGAQHVYCIDVGTHQLHEKLQNHPQVTWKEQFHVNQLDEGTFDQTFAWIVMDVSFISMLKALPFALNVLKKQGQVLALFKPQFEVSRQHLSKGVVKDPGIAQQYLLEAMTNIQNTYPSVQNIQSHPSPLKGPKGNQEFFLWIQASVA